MSNDELLARIDAEIAMAMTTYTTCGCYTVAGHPNRGYRCSKHYVARPIPVEPPYTFREHCANGVYHFRRAIFRIAKMLGAQE